VAIADKDDEPKEYRRVMRAVNLFMVVEILINIYYYARHLIIDAPEMRIFDFVFGAVVSALIPVTIKLYANSIRAKQWLRELEGAGEVHQEAPEAPEAPDTQEDIPMFHVKHEAVVHAKHEAPQEATPVQEAEIIDPDPVPYPEFTFKVTTPFNPPPLETYPEDIVFHPVQEIPSPVLQDPAQIEALIEAKIESAYSDIIKKVKSEVEDICITFKQYTMDDALIKDQIKSEVLQYAENEIKATLDAELKTSPDLQTVDSFYHDTIEAKITEITEAHNKAFYRNIESLIEDAIKKYIQK
jgi:Co/Zn/Cd efflux system component